MENVLITFIYGPGFAQRPETLVTFNSLKKFTTFKKVAIVNNISSEDLNVIDSYFDETFHAKNEITKSVSDRFLSYYLWACENYNKYKNILHIDSRDVIIQSDPFEWMNQHPNKKVFISTECFLQRSRDWNQEDQAKLQSTMRNKYDYLDNYVLNSGTIGGEFNILVELFLNIYGNANRNIDISEQSIVNYFYPQFVKNPVCMITDAKKDNFCILGESINWADVKYLWDTNNIMNLNNETYCIFHQWDRTALREEILNNWGKIM